MVREFWEDLQEEFYDFFDDYFEHFTKRRTHPEAHTQRNVVLHGMVVAVRPAYVFAERIDTLLKILFAVSIVLSAITSTFLGFIKLSDLLEVLINTLWGRSCMFVIGMSYLLSALWKLIHLGKKE